MYTAKQSSSGLLMLAISLLGLLFISVAGAIDVYRFRITGAIYEFIALPLTASSFVCPVFSAVYWIKERFSKTSFNLYALISSGIALFLLVQRICSIEC